MGLVATSSFCTECWLSFFLVAASCANFAFHGSQSAVMTSKAVGVYMVYYGTFSPADVTFLNTFVTNIGSSAWINGNHYFFQRRRWYVCCLWHYAGRLCSGDQRRRLLLDIYRRVESPQQCHHSQQLALEFYSYLRSCSWTQCCLHKCGVELCVAFFLWQLPIFADP